MLIAIDGPAGAGKSTVARATARELGFTYLDSGAMYRCVALLSLASPEREPAELARAARIELREAGHDADDRSDRDRRRGRDPRERARCVADEQDGDRRRGEAAAASRTILDGHDVSEQIRTPEVTEAASRVARDPGVREALVAKQRALIAGGDWVAEGRDIGTVVAPDAALKIYLTADPRERAKRRAAELGADPATVLAEQTIRDERDATRRHSPLRPAPGAVTLDTTDSSVDEVVARIATLARAAAVAETGRSASS